MIWHQFQKFKAEFFWLILREVIHIFFLIQYTRKELGTGPQKWRAEDNFQLLILQKKLYIIDTIFCTKITLLNCYYSVRVICNFPQLF